MHTNRVISDNSDTIWTDENLMILNPLSIGYISGQALMHSCTHAKGEIDNQSLITGFSMKSGIYIINFN